jgi:hypothetical protein
MPEGHGRPTVARNLELPALVAVARQAEDLILSLMEKRMA